MTSRVTQKTPCRSAAAGLLGITVSHRDTRGPLLRFSAAGPAAENRSLVTQHSTRPRRSSRVQIDEGDDPGGSAFRRVELEVYGPHLGRDISLRQPDSNRCAETSYPPASPGFGLEGA
jgi:hypothetical protein